MIRLGFTGNPYRQRHSARFDSGGLLTDSATFHWSSENDHLLAMGQVPRCNDRAGTKNPSEEDEYDAHDVHWMALNQAWRPVILADRDWKGQTHTSLQIDEDGVSARDRVRKAIPEAVKDCPNVVSGY